jgi:ferritin-like metal-binding protein YciE
MQLNTLQDLFHEQLKDVYSAEKQLVKALPKLADASHGPSLGEAFTSHLRETEQHVTRLEQVFGLIGETPKAKTCKAMKGLVDEGDDAAGEDGDPAIVDAGIIAAAQRVEHYEIAAYGCLIRYAENLGLQEAVTLLNTTLDEEKAADEKLTEISDAEVGTGSRTRAATPMKRPATEKRVRSAKRDSAYAE